MKLVKQCAGLLLAVLLIFGSCKKNKPEQSGEGSYYYEDSSTSFFPRGFAAVQNAPIYNLSGSEPDWIGSPDFGEPLELDPAQINKPLSPGKSVNYTPRQVVIDETYRYLIPIIWKNLNGWIDVGNYAAENAPVGAVTNSFTIQNDVIRWGELAVFHPRDKEIMTAPISAWLEKRLLQNSISFKDEDVETAKILAKARADRNKERASALMREALEKYPSSTLSPMIKETLSPQENKIAATESLVAVFTTASNETAVYSSPGFSSTVVTRLEPYINVRTTERTTTTVSSRTGSAHWYHINDPAEGWIFGLDLEGAD